MDDVNRRGLPKYLVAYIEYKKEVAKEIETAALKELAAKETPAFVKAYIDYLFKTMVDEAEADMPENTIEIPIAYKEYALEEIAELQEELANT